MLDRLAYSFIKKRWEKYGEDPPSFEDFQLAMGRFFEIFQFHPGKTSFLGIPTSKSIDTILTVNNYSPSFVNFVSEDYPGLSFSVHALEFNDPAEYSYWDFLAQKDEMERSAKFKGEFYPNLFSSGQYIGAVKTNNRSIEVIVKNHRVTGLKTFYQQAEDGLTLLNATVEGLKLMVAARAKQKQKV